MNCQCCGKKHAKITLTNHDKVCIECFFALDYLDTDKKWRCVN